MFGQGALGEFALGEFAPVNEGGPAWRRRLAQRLEGKDLWLLNREKDDAEALALLL